MRLTSSSCPRRDSGSEAATAALRSSSPRSDPNPRPRSRHSLSPSSSATAPPSSRSTPRTQLHLKHPSSGRSPSTTASDHVPPPTPAACSASDHLRRSPRRCRRLNPRRLHAGRHPRDYQLNPEAPLGRWDIGGDGHATGRDGTAVRYAVARGERWRSVRGLVPGTGASPRRRCVSSRCSRASPTDTATRTCDPEGSALARAGSSSTGALPSTDRRSGTWKLSGNGTWPDPWSRTRPRPSGPWRIALIEAKASETSAAARRAPHTGSPGRWRELVAARLGSVS